MDDDHDTILFNDCNWSDLHEDILELILKEFSTVEDCLRFGCVCVPWRSLLVPHLHPDLLNPQLPLLMIPSLPWPHYPTPPPPLPVPMTTPPNKLQKFKKEEQEEAQTRSFYNVFEKRVYADLHIKLPYNMNCRGSSHGWIIASGNESNDFCVELFNPFISINNEYQKIQLPPPLTAFPYKPDTEVFGEHFLQKAILSANPTTTDYVVMAMYSGVGKLCFWKPGDHVWTIVPLGWEEGIIDSVDDVIYDHHSGLFYFLTKIGEVKVCDCSNVDDHKPPKVRTLAPPAIPYTWGAFKKYLVESEGDLLVLHSFSDTIDGSEKLFLVFKLRKEGDKEEEEEEKEEVIKDSCDNKLEAMIKHYCAKEWKYMDTLPDRMLFLGDNASISLASSEFPGGKSSCIYYSDDRVEENRSEGYLDMGIFNMEDRTVEKLHPMGSKKYMSPVNIIWVEPTLNCCLQFKHHI